MKLDTRYTYSIAPINLDDELAKRYFALFVRQHAESGAVRLLVKVHQSPDKVVRHEEERMAALARIGRLEQLYTVIDCYRWLATRFGRDVYPDVALAEQTAVVCGKEIEMLIAQLGIQKKRGSRKR